MEIQQLRHLQAAANSQSYAQAAKKCFTSRQNIAHSVKALEGEVGTPLFERKGNRMVLTEEGRQVAYVVDEVLERVDRLGSMFQDGLAARSTQRFRRARRWWRRQSQWELRFEDAPWRRG